MAKIMIVDDEETIRKLLTSALERRGFEVVAVEDGFRACDVYPTFQPDVVVSDIKMPRMTGFEMHDRLREKYPELCPVIFITGHGEKSVAIESLRKGAFNYLEKPFDMEEFFHTLGSAVDKRQLTRDLADAQRKLQEKFEARTELVKRINKKTAPTKKAFSVDALGQSPAMAAVKETLSDLQKKQIGSDMSVLITGPSGAGKEVVARIIHEISSRSSGPWVALNCGALPDSLIESELFGHEKGAFTGAAQRRPGVFEMADGGTLFLDEIGELPLHLQTRLLRAIQEQSFRRVGGTEEIKVDVRIIAATNKNLRQGVQEKTFREDLYYRLNTVHIDVPALRDRKEDVVPLARILLAEAVEGMENPPRDFSPEAQKVLIAHDWQGNVRELKSCVQKAALLAGGPDVSVDVINKALGKPNVVTMKPDLKVEKGESLSPTTAAAANATETAGTSYHRWKKQYMQQVERTYLMEQLTRYQGNVSAMARAMKISRPNLCRLLKKHTLTAESFRKAA